MRWTAGVAATLGMLVLAACSGGGDSDSNAAADNADRGPPRSALEFAEALRCEEPEAEDPAEDPDLPPLPIEAVECHIGDAQFSVEVYKDSQDVDAVLDALAPFCGQRAVGDTWVVEVNTIESAERAATALGGRVFVSPGCNP